MGAHPAVQHFSSVCYPLHFKTHCIVIFVQVLHHVKLNWQMSSGILLRENLIVYPRRQFLKDEDEDEEMNERTKRQR